MKLKQRFFRTLLYPLLWRVIGMPGRSYAGPLEALTREQGDVKQNLEAHVNKLANAIGERNARNYPGFLECERYITEVFTANKWNIRKESITFDGVEMQNIEAEKRGTTKPDEIIVVGAHYDTVYGSPGADDNASGVAALLELARLLSDSVQGRTLRLVAFANEENPNSAWETMGSYAYARGCRERGENIVGMISLEMIGVFSDEHGSQRYPKPFSWLYPETGNFIAFVGNIASRKWVHKCIGSFREQSMFPSEGIAAPAFVKDINRSDHWSFWQFGYSAFMLTDTSNFRNQLYHTIKDTPDILDFDRMTRVTTGMAEVLTDIVNE